MGAAGRVGPPQGAGWELGARRWRKAAAPAAAVALVVVAEDEPEEGLEPVGTLEVLGAVEVLGPMGTLGRLVDPLGGFWLSLPLLLAAFLPFLAETCCQPSWLCGTALELAGRGRGGAV